MEKLAITYKVKHSFTIWPGNSTPIYLSEIQTYGNTKTYFYVIITQNRKYWKYPSTREWVNRQWHTCAMEYYPAVERSKTIDIHNTDEPHIYYAK